MPTISLFYGILIRMFWIDNDRHKMPHMHAYYGVDVMLHGKEKMLPRVSSVEIYQNYCLLLTFRNGERKIYDAKPLFEYSMYKNLKNVFQEAKVEYGTVVWPGDIDISPDTLYLNSTAIYKWKS